MSSDTRKRIEKAIAVLDRRKSALHRGGQYIGSPDIAFAAVAEESRTTLEEVRETVSAMERDGDAFDSLGHDFVAVTRHFREKYRAIYDAG